MLGWLLNLGFAGSGAAVVVPPVVVDEDVGGPDDERYVAARERFVRHTYWKPKKEPEEELEPVTVNVARDETRQDGVKTRDSLNLALLQRSIELAAQQALIDSVTAAVKRREEEDKLSLMLILAALK